MPQATAPQRTPLYKLIKQICSGIFRPSIMLPRRSAVNMNTAGFSEMLLKFCQVTRRHVPNTIFFIHAGFRTIDLSFMKRSLIMCLHSLLRVKAYNEVVSVCPSA